MPPCRPIDLLRICSHNTTLRAYCTAENATPLFRLYPAAQHKSHLVTDKHPKALLVESAGSVYISTSCLMSESVENHTYSLIQSRAAESFIMSTHAGGLLLLPCTIPYLAPYLKIGTMLFDINHDRQAQRRRYLRHNLPFLGNHREVRQRQVPLPRLTNPNSNSKSF